MAEAMKHGVIAGRLAYKAGRIPKSSMQTARAPLTGCCKTVHSFSAQCQHLVSFLTFFWTTVEQLVTDTDDMKPDFRLYLITDRKLFTSVEEMLLQSRGLGMAAQRRFS